MFLKSLQLNGFKGFKDKTLFKFNSGLGAIVGPNGCGKSNVIDAFKWVWGEQRVAELRGAKIDDLIFNGSKHFKSNNFCEVEVVFNNQDKILPVSYQEVSILRRIYRSGETEIFINHKPCRLKDVFELLNDTGIGKSNYSIIEQGKIERVLSDKLENRRRLFEESASLSDYRFKKKEYELKIKQTKENLTRVRDVLKVKLKQQERLEAQAKKSEVFFDLEEKLKENHRKIFSHQLFLLNERKKSNDLEFEALEGRMDEKQRQLEKRNTAFQVFIQALESKQEDRNKTDKKIIQVEEKINSSRFEINYIDDNLAQLKSDFFNQEKSSQQFQKDKEEIDKIIVSNKKQILKEEEKIIKFKKNLTSHQEKRKSLQAMNASLETKKNSLLVDLKLKKKSWGKIALREKEINRKLIDEIDDLKKQLEKKDYLKNIDLLSLAEKKLHQNVEENNLSKIRSEFKRYHEIFNTFFETENLLYSFFFSTTGTYFQKSEVEKNRQKLSAQINQLELDDARLEEKIETNKRQTDEMTSLINHLEIDKMRTNENLKIITQENELKRQQLISLENYHKTVVENKRNLASKKEYFIQEKEKKQRHLLELETELQDLKNELEQFSKKQEKENLQKKTMEKDLQRLNQALDLLKVKKHKVAIDYEIIEKEKINLAEKLNYQLNLKLNEIPSSRLEDLNSVKGKIALFKREMGELGKVNLIAKVEYDELAGETDDLAKQKSDIEKSIVNLEKVSLKLQEQAQKIFLDVLSRTSENFNKLIQQLFEGGSGRIALENERDPLNSDIKIEVEPPGKKLQKISLFSGGEKSLISLAVMIALFFNNPSPICLLDEVDAALDNKNLERLMNLLTEIKKKSQVLLISHNQKTMDIVDYMYGITMKQGVSKLFSLKL